MKTLKILIVDDHALLREGLKLFLETQEDFNVVGQADLGEDVSRLSEELNPDVVIMDVAMPGLGGAGATMQLQHTHPHVKVLVFSGCEDEFYIRRLIAVGAMGYVLKSSPVTEIVRAVRTVACGNLYFDPPVSKKLSKGKAGVGAKESLSKREIEVLCSVGRGFTNKEIAQSMDISIKTVETYKTRFSRKLKLHSRAEIVRYALLRGCLHDEGATDLQTRNLVK